LYVTGSGCGKLWKKDGVALPWPQWSARFPLLAQKDAREMGSRLFSLIEEVRIPTRLKIK